ncbi:hypothetical protein D3C76_1605910 [compost metagenome]
MQDDIEAEVSQLIALLTALKLKVHPHDCLQFLADRCKKIRVEKQLALKGDGIVDNLAQIADALVAMKTFMYGHCCGEAPHQPVIADVTQEDTAAWNQELHCLAKNVE